MTLQENSDQQWIVRCFDLARRGLGHVSPNPPVGAVLVYNNRILGEGYHTAYGAPHAEVEAIRNVKDDERHLIPESVLYVSLEPCCLTGKTPPCTDLILQQGIRDVRYSATDPNPAIAGRSRSLLMQKGIHVYSGILEEEGMELIRPFRINITEHRPFIILKWAQSRYGFMGQADERVLLSHAYTSVWTHHQRASVDAIMVGARTVQTDDPWLTTREAPGPSPARVIFDYNANLASHYNAFRDDGQRIFYFSLKENPTIDSPHIRKYVIDDGQLSIPQQIMQKLFAEKIGILLIEGGAYLLNLFIEENSWDEAWVIRTQHILDHGIKAPVVKGKLLQEIESVNDTITGISNSTIA